MANACLAQFERDFSLFLKSRSEEIVTGGRLLGRSNPDPTGGEICNIFDILSEALNDMVSEVFYLLLPSFFFGRSIFYPLHHHKPYMNLIFSDAETKWVFVPPPRGRKRENSLEKKQLKTTAM